MHTSTLCTKINILRCALRCRIKENRKRSDSIMWASRGAGDFFTLYDEWHAS